MYITSRVVRACREICMILSYLNSWEKDRVWTVENKPAGWSPLFTVRSATEMWLGITHLVWGHLLGKLEQSQIGKQGKIWLLGR